MRVMATDCHVSHLLRRRIGRCLVRSVRFETVHGLSGSARNMLRPPWRRYQLVCLRWDTTLSGQPLQQLIHSGTTHQPTEWFEVSNHYTTLTYRSHPCCHVSVQTDRRSSNTCLSCCRTSGFVCRNVVNNTNARSDSRLTNRATNTFMKHTYNT